MLGFWPVRWGRIGSGRVVPISTLVARNVLNFALFALFVFYFIHFFFFSVGGSQLLAASSLSALIDGCHG